MSRQSTATATATSPTPGQGDGSEVEFIDQVATLLAELYVSRMEATRASHGGPVHSEVHATRRGQVTKTPGPKKACLRK